MIRIGSGFDVHAFGTGEHVVLGGVRIAHSHGLLAHSDGDLLIHALCDVLLGALALGDIGRHFPDTDPASKGADSRKILEAVCGMARKKGYGCVNVDAVVVAVGTSAHQEVLEMVAPKSLAILCEKPIAPTIAGTLATTGDDMNRDER